MLSVLCEEMNRVNDLKNNNADPQDQTAQEQEDNTQNTPEPQRSTKWVKGALTRGFYSAVQVFHAANLSMITLAPRVAKVFGVSWLTGGLDKLHEKIAHCERKIAENDLEPTKPGLIKSAISFAAFNAGYLLPVIGTGVAAGLAAGPAAGLIVAALANTHAMMGEGYIATARKHAGSKNEAGVLADKRILENCFQDDDFRSKANKTVAIRGGICMAFTLAAGPVARAMGGFTAEAFRSISRVLPSSAISDQLLRITQKSAVKSVVKGLHKPLGKIFSEAATTGPSAMIARVTGAVAVGRGATSWLSRIWDKAAKDESSEQKEHNEAVADEVVSKTEATADEQNITPPASKSQQPRL